MKYFLKRTYTQTYGTFGTRVYVSWLWHSLGARHFDPLNRTAFDKQALDEIRKEHGYFDEEKRGDVLVEKETYEEIPADGLAETYSDEVKEAKRGR